MSWYAERISGSAQGTAGIGVGAWVLDGGDSGGDDALRDVDNVLLEAGYAAVRVGGACPAAHCARAAVRGGTFQMMLTSGSAGTRAGLSASQMILSDRSGRLASRA